MKFVIDIIKYEQENFGSLEWSNNYIIIIIVKQVASALNLDLQFIKLPSVTRETVVFQTV